MVDPPAMPPGAVDDHCHLGSYHGFYQPGNTADGLVRTLDRVGIERACVFSSLSITLDVRAGNDLSLAAARAFPDRLLAYLCVDPHRGEREIDAELARCFEAGARGIKLHTQLADHPFDGPGYASALAFADAHRLPLISHGTGTPDTLRRVARAHPGAHLIVAHAGAGGAATQDLHGGVYRVARDVPNVYLDTASSIGRFGGFAAVVRAVGAGRLVYGSDLPWMCASHQVGRVLYAPIAADDKRRIMGGTMARLLSTRQ